MIIQNLLNWSDDFVYIYSISVLATTLSNQYTNFWFTFSYDEQIGHVIYADAVGEPPLVRNTCVTLTIDIQGKKQLI